MFPCVVTGKRKSVINYFGESRIVIINETMLRIVLKKYFTHGPIIALASHTLFDI